ncbi:MAG: hypothetical protein HUU10_08590 [Bacteroidetes bacterium]|nr:hypothetical protein [Bacteroidota bacterium]
MIPILILITLLACQEPEDAEPRNLTLKILDIEPTYVTFSLQIKDLPRPALIVMTRDGFWSQTVRVFGTDTVLHDQWDLEPKKSYTWQAHETNGQDYTHSSNVVSGTTGDTTSHAFTFSLTELGPSASFVNDVWIVNENNIWVAGEFHDFSKPDTLYNVLHWDGTTWNKHRLIFHLEYANPDYDLNIFGEAAGVYVTNSGRVWVVGENSGISYTDDWGKKWSVIYGLRNMAMTANKIWGYGGPEFHVAGYAGGVLYFNGTRFFRLRKTTDLDMVDLWGNSEGVFVIAGNFDFNIQPPIVKVQETSLELFPNKIEGLANYQRGIWVTEKHKYLANGSLFRYDKHRKMWFSVHTGSAGVDAGAITVRGNSDFDYWIGNGFNLAHFNGGTFKVYPEVYNLGAGRMTFHRLAVKEGLLVAVGFANNRDYLVMGRRK